MEKKRIINMDESSISHSNYRNYSWCISKDTTFKDKKTIAPRITLVAAIDNKGNKYASFFLGNSNSKTTCIMLATLVQVLDKEDLNWRDTSILLLDGAPYHKTLEVKQIMQDLQVPVMFASPYSPQLCPIELFFGQVKSGDINPKSELQNKR